jgi:nucleotide-binding universal stress UspA family protein
MATEHLPPFQKLLLATEHGEFDTGAEAVALALARHSGQPLAAVLPLTSNAELESVAPDWVARLDAQASRCREQLLAQAGQAGVALTVQVRRGPEPYAEIVAEARRLASDLIIIRRRGQRGFLANLLVGEMVSKVVAHAPCSVLVAPRGAAMWQRRVLLGVDPAAPDEAALQRAAALARACGLPLSVVVVAERGDPRATAVLDQAVASATAQGVASRGELRTGRVHEALMAATAEQGADLLVIGRHRADNLPRAWIGGTAQKVLGLAEGPVLVHVNP